MIAFNKIIHQIWLQGKEFVPVKYDSNIAKIKNMLNNEWQYIIWDEVEILKVIKQNKSWLDTYYKFIYLHQKVDFARYCILYLYGGVYLDIDSYLIKPLDKLMDEYQEYDTIVSTIYADNVEKYISGVEEFINNGVIISKKDSIVMKTIIDTITDTIIGNINDGNNEVCGWYESKVNCIMKTTGPRMFSKVIYDLKNVPNLVKILPYEYLEPCKENHIECDITDNTYVVHVHESTWVPEYWKNIHYCYTHYSLGFYIILLVIIALGLYFMIKGIE